MIGSEDFQTIVGSGAPLIHQVFVMGGGVAGAAMIMRDARPWPLEKAQRRGLFAAAFVGAFVGAALPAYFVGGLIQARAEELTIGPKTILGGVLLSYFLAVAYKKVMGITHDTSDAFARGTAWMMAIGRLGCWFQHCCFGRLAPAGWPGVDMGDGHLRIPTQLLEFFGLMLLVAIVEVLHRQHAMPGRRLFVFYLGYGILRFTMEFLREPVAGSFAGLGAYQWLALALGFIGLHQVTKRTVLDQGRIPC